MTFEVTILGCSSATPIAGRNPTAQLVQLNGNYFLIDCGEGTQHQMLRFGISYQKIDRIFISHLHGDHYLGLVGLISTMNLHGRQKTLHLYANEKLQQIIEIQLEASDSRLNFELRFHPTQAENTAVLYENSEIKIESFVLNHRIPCTGFKFTQIFPKRKLIKEKVKDIPASFLPKLKNGEDISLADGSILAFETLSIPGKKNKSYAYCSDTKPDESYLNEISEVDVLYHEATFLHEFLERAQFTHHSTALQAAEIALKVKAKRLIIGHFSSRYKNNIPLLEEAQKVFPICALAYDGLILEI